MRSALPSPAWVRRTKWVDSAAFHSALTFPFAEKKTWVKDQVLQAQDSDSRVLDFPQLLTYHGRIPDHRRIHPQLKSCGRVLSKKGNHFLICWNHKTHLTRKKKKSIILLIPQNLASAPESFGFPSSDRLGHFSSLPPLPDVGPYVKITQGRTLEILQSWWGLPSGCPQPSSATFTAPQQHAGHAEQGEPCCCCCCCKCWQRSLHRRRHQPAVVLCWVCPRKPSAPGARHPAGRFGQLWIR